MTKDKLVHENIRLKIGNVEDPVVVADTFNKYFVEEVLNIFGNNASANMMMMMNGVKNGVRGFIRMNPNKTEQMNLWPVSEKEIVGIINTTSNKTSSGIDNTPYNVLKACNTSIKDLSYAWLTLWPNKMYSHNRLVNDC